MSNIITIQNKQIDMDSIGTFSIHRIIGVSTEIEMKSVDKKSSHKFFANYESEMQAIEDAHKTLAEYFLKNPIDGTSLPKTEA